MARLIPGGDLISCQSTGPVSGLSVVNYYEVERVVVAPVPAILGEACANVPAFANSLHRIEGHSGSLIESRSTPARYGAGALCAGTGQDVSKSPPSVPAGLDSGENTEPQRFSGIAAAGRPVASLNWCTRGNGEYRHETFQAPMPDVTFFVSAPAHLPADDRLVAVHSRPLPDASKHAKPAL